MITRGLGFILGVVASITFSLASDLPQEAIIRSPRTMLEASIKALGGKAKLRELERCYYKHHVRFSQSSTMSISEMWIDSPKRSKQMLHFSEMGRDMVAIRVEDANNVWVKNNNDTTVALTAVKIKDDNSYAYSQVSMRLYPFLEDPKYELEMRDDIAVGGQLAHHIRVAVEPATRLDLYFDRSTSLLLRTELVVNAGAMAGMELQMEYRKYRDFDGLKIATSKTMRHNGQLLSEDELVEVRRVKSFPEGTFAKP